MLDPAALQREQSLIELLHIKNQQLLQIGQDNAALGQQVQARQQRITDLENELAEVRRLIQPVGPACGE